MLKGLWIAFKRVINSAPVEDADAEVGAPYAQLCNTLEFYDKNEDLDCDVPQAPATGSSTRRRRR